MWEKVVHMTRHTPFINRDMYEGLDLVYKRNDPSLLAGTKYANFYILTQVGLSIVFAYIEENIKVVKTVTHKKRTTLSSFHPIEVKEDDFVSEEELHNLHVLCEKCDEFIFEENDIQYDLENELESISVQDVLHHVLDDISTELRIDTLSNSIKDTIDKQILEFISTIKNHGAIVREKFPSIDFAEVRYKVLLDKVPIRKESAFVHKNDLLLVPETFNCVKCDFETQKEEEMRNHTCD